VRVEGDTLHISPRARLTPTLREQIREHKAALLLLLATEAEPGGPWGYASALLGEEVWLCMSMADAEALRAEGVVAYIPSEIRALHAMKRRDPAMFEGKLASIHEAKKLFDATLEGVEVC
jgi:hypothetical protein